MDFRLNLKRKDWIVIGICLLVLILIWGIIRFIVGEGLWSMLVAFILFVVNIGILLEFRRRWYDVFLKERREQNKKMIAVWKQVDFLLDGELINDEVYKKILSGRPISVVPNSLINDYTMGGRVKISYWYFNDTQYNESKIYDKYSVDRYLRLIKKGKVENQVYGQTNNYLISAINKYPIKDKKVVVFGSVDPWYESIVLYYGGDCTTIEYNKIYSRDDRIKVMTSLEYDENPIEFDAALSISSFEHDGLGRYGDRLNPDGDLEAMRKGKRILKKGGIMFLSVPIGEDLVAWNAYRRYGPIRLPKLLEGWKVLDRFGFRDDMFNESCVKEASLQPVFVLENV